MVVGMDGVKCLWGRGRYSGGGVEWIRWFWGRWDWLGLSEEMVG